MNRRVLVVGYSYPDLNMGGVRLRRICRLLPRYGWDPVVLTHPSPPGPDAASPPDVRVEPVAAPDLAQIYRWFKPGRSSDTPAHPAGAGSKSPVVQNIGLTSKINRWLMIPDKCTPWLRPAVRRGRELLRERPFDAIFASLDPRTALLVATRLSRESGVPMVVEYRDLWVANPYYHVTQPTALHRALHARLERRVMRQATRVSAVCRGIAERLTRSYGPLLRAPIELHYNFFDPAEYPPPTPRSPGAPMVVSYAGNMYTSRSPNQFFEGMQAFIQRHDLAPTQFRFRWAGGISGVTGLDEVLARTRLQPYIEFLGQVAHQNALQMLVDSDAALLLQAPDDDIHIPGKLFETMGAGVPLLALANPCEVSEIIRDCQAGWVSPYDTTQIAATLSAAFSRWKKGDAWTFAEAQRQKYSANAAVARLARMLDDTAQPTPTPS